MAWPTWLTLPPPNDARPRPPPSQPSSPSTPAPPAQSPPSSSPSTPIAEPNIIQRNRPIALLIAGCAFTLLSARATRRAVIKRQIATRPDFYHPSNEKPIIPVSGAFEAVEALSLASVNVLSWALLWTGGVAWATGVKDLETMRRKVRGGLG